MQNEEVFYTSRHVGKLESFDDTLTANPIWSLCVLKASTHLSHLVPDRQETRGQWQCSIASCIPLHEKMDF